MLYGILDDPRCQVVGILTQVATGLPPKVAGKEVAAEECQHTSRIQVRKSGRYEQLFGQNVAVGAHFHSDDTFSLLMVAHGVLWIVHLADLWRALGVHLHGSPARRFVKLGECLTVAVLFKVNAHAKAKIAFSAIANVLDMLHLCRYIPIIDSLPAARLFRRQRHAELPESTPTSPSWVSAPAKFS